MVHRSIPFWKKTSNSKSGIRLMDPLMTYAEACALLHVGKSKIRFLISQGDLDMRDFGHRTKLITRKSVDKLINTGMPLRRYSKIKFRKAV